jgi:UDP-N-acetylglucosamine 3-dehydrogenase
LIKAAVIGVGAMGQHHARVYAELPGVELVGVSDVDRATAERVARLRNTRAYTGYRDMLAACRPDLVSVAVPTQAHYAPAAEALAAGCHVLVEKPIAATLEEGQALIDQAAATGRKLMVGHIVRFNPAMQALKAHLEAGELGQVFQVRCRRLGPFPTRVQDVGVVIDLATHDLDIMNYLIQSSIVRLYAETAQKIHTAHEDTLVGTLRFANGVIGSLDIDWLTPTKIRELTVTGERGMFVVDDLNQELYFYENEEASDEQWSNLILLHGVSAGRMIRYPIPRREPLRVEIEAFIDAVQNDGPVPVSASEGLMALRLAQALVHAGQRGQVMELGEPRSSG